LDIEGRWCESVQEHRAILDALGKRDAGRAADLLKLHVTHTGATVLQTLSERKKLN